MARAITSRRQEALYVPFVAPADEPHLFIVKVREGSGCFYLASGPTTKRGAHRRVREMREEMFRAWETKTHGVSREDARALGERRYLDGLRDGREGRATGVFHDPR